MYQDGTFVAETLRYVICVLNFYFFSARSAEPFLLKPFTWNCKTITASDLESE